MPTPRINMRKLKDALSLQLLCEQSLQQIASAFGDAKGNVAKYCTLTGAPTRCFVSCKPNRLREPLR